MRRFILLFLCISGKALASDIDTLPGVRISNAGAGSDRIVFRCCTAITTADQPLVVLDGIPIDSFDLSKIDPNDILRIDVLKNSVATAIYGCRAMRGVIIITTKRSNHLIVLDADSKKVLPGATVNILSNNKLKQSLVLNADQKGEIDLGSLNLAEAYSMEISCVGYQMQTVKISKAGFGHVIKMQKKYEAMDTVFIESELMARRVRCFFGVTYVKSFTGQKQESTHTLFSLCPNPVSSAGTVALTLMQPVSGKADLINASGQTVQTTMLYQENANPVIHLSHAIPGCYFVRIYDSKSQKAITQKLIVQ